MTLYAPIPNPDLSVDLTRPQIGWSQRLLLAAVTVIALSAVTVSISLNMIYSYNHAAQGMAAWTSAMAALMLDLVKLTMTLLLPIWIKAGDKLKVIFGTVTFVVMTTCSLWFAFGFQSFSKTDSYATREHSQFTYQHKRAVHDDLQRKIADLVPSRPVAAVMADLAKARQQRRWRPSKGCTDVTIQKSRTFCNHYFELQKELETAKARARLEDQLNTMRASLELKTNLNPTGAADPQADIIERLTGLSRKPLMDITTLMFAIAIEIAASMAVFSAGWLWRESGFRFGTVHHPRKNHSRQPHSPTVRSDQDALVHYMRERLEPALGEHTNATKIFDDYRAYCRKANFKPVSQTRFGRAMKVAGYAKVKKSGHIYYCDIKIHSS